jgi:hypothetical protein
LEITQYKERMLITEKLDYINLINKNNGRVEIIQTR